MDEVPEEEPDPRQTEVEGPRRFSESRLFALQRSFFERRGLAAWDGGGVPSWITTNPFIARVYARLVDGFREDLARAGRPARPLVVELGAGQGRFGWLFLRAMDEARRARGEREPPIRYLMTDGNPALVHFWRGHAAFEPFVDEGMVDFAGFDVGNPAEPWLTVARRPLSEVAPGGPVVVLANYVFDCTPQDAFVFAHDRLHEVLVSLHAEGEPEDPLDPDLLSRLRCEYHRRGTTADYYRDRFLDGPLSVCAREAEGGVVMFPHAALRALEHLARYGAGRLVLIAADKGTHRLADTRDREEPDLVLHGCFSLGVNFRAFGAWAERAGGFALLPPHRPTWLDVCAFLRSFRPETVPALRRAYRESVVEGGPEDYYHLTAALGADGFAPTVEETLGLLRFSAFDAKMLALCRAGLLKHLPEASERAREEFRLALRRVRANHYHVRGAEDLPFELGYLSIHAGDHEGALAFFGESRALYGESEATTFNIDLCRRHLASGGEG